LRRRNPHNPSWSNNWGKIETFSFLLSLRIVKRLYGLDCVGAFHIQKVEFDTILQVPNLN
jgi:hypothetical protein